LAKILIIDDDPDIVDSMRVTLEANSYEVEDAQNSEEGLRKVKEFGPDLILLDVMMETTTAGFHVAYHLRNTDPSSEYAAYSKVPILMITSVSEKVGMPFDPAKDEDFMPVDGYVEKPVLPSDLLKKVKDLIGS
jgi:CheY-like chemotaxis protein